MPTSPAESRRLDSWKEIAAFLRRSVRTVKRWEAERGLPVRRAPGRRGGIHADTAELTEWLRSAPEAVETRAGRLAAIPWTWVLVAALVVVAITAGWLSSHSRAPAAVAQSRDPQAAELYREAMHDWNSRTAVGLHKAQDEFTQAIVRDPGYAPAYAGLANTYNLLREYTAMPDAYAYPQAEAAARRAIALDPSLARAHAALGFVLYYWHWDGPGAVAEFETGARLDPRDPLIHHWYANVLKSERRFPEALRQIELAQSLDPNSSAVLADKGFLLAVMGRAAEARRILTRMEEVDPTFSPPHAYLANVALAAGDYPAFLDEEAQVAELHGDATLRAVNQAARAGFRRGGARTMFEAMLAEQQRLAAQGGGGAHGMARTYVLLGDRRQARAWLKKAIADHDPSVLNVAGDPVMDTLRDDPDFAFLKSVTKGRAS